MKIIAISLLALVMFLSSAISQETTGLFNRDNYSNINADSRGLNTYREIKVNLSNTGPSEKKLIFLVIHFLKMAIPMSKI